MRASLSHRCTLLTARTGFGSKVSEVLQAVESTIHLYNSFNEPLAWEIAKCEPFV